MIQWDSAVGIQICEDRLVFATVSKGFRGFELKNCRVLESYRDLSVSESKNWVQEYLRSAVFNRQNVVIGLPRDKVVIRHCKVPLEAEDNLDQVVQFHVSRFEPLEEQQSYYGYVVADRNERREKIELQVVMVRRDYFETQLNFLNKLGLYPRAVRISSTGLHQAFLVHQDGYPQDGTGVIIEINNRNIEFVALMGKDRFFSVAVCLEEKDLSIRKIADELDRFLSQADLPGQGLSHLYVGGINGSRLFPALREQFSKCELLWSNLKLKTKNGVNLSILTEAMGLAVSGMNKSFPAQLNLIPVEKRVRTEKPRILSTLLLLGVLVIMASAVTTREYFQQKRLLGQIQNQIQSIQPEAERSMALVEEIEEKEKQLVEIQKLVKGRQRVLRVLSELTEIIPEDSFLQTLNIQGDRLSLTGYSQAASSLLRVLLGSKYLETVESRYITPDRTNREREKFSFEARIEKD